MRTRKRDPSKPMSRGELAVEIVEQIGRIRRLDAQHDQLKTRRARALHGGKLFQEAFGESMTLNALLRANLPTILQALTDDGSGTKPYRFVQDWIGRVVKPKPRGCICRGCLKHYRAAHEAIGSEVPAGFREPGTRKRPTEPAGRKV